MLTEEYKLEMRSAFALASIISHSEECKLITQIYGDRTANRSKVPLINHIFEGVTILYNIDASEDAMKAFCLHPVVQNDEDLKSNYDTVINNSGISSKIIVLAMEYRNIANQYLSQRVIQSLDDIKLSPLKDVNDMLIADKIQNYKDFIIYHKGTHPRSKELDAYFKHWLDKLECWNAFWDHMPEEYAGKVH